VRARLFRGYFCSMVYCAGQILDASEPLLPGFEIWDQSLKELLHPYFGSLDIFSLAFSPRFVTAPDCSFFSCFVLLISTSSLVRGVFFKPPISPSYSSSNQILSSKSVCVIQLQVRCVLLLAIC
jgi:hypothetical protein